MIARDFVEFVMSVTERLDTTLMIIRTTGPDAAQDAEKVNEVYSVYKSNFDSERVDFFDKFMYNEFTFLEFDSEEDAYEQLLCYLHEVVRNEDVTAFNFKEVV